MDKLSWLKIPEREELPEDVQTLFNKAEEKLGHIPNVFNFMALTPKHFMKWFKYYDFLMRNDETELSRKEREMIGVVVSSENRCEYCLASHASYLREITADPVFVELLIHNYRRAHLTKRERSMLDFVIMVTHESYKMSPEELELLREVGFSDEGISEITQIAAMFNFTNRMGNALGWKPNEAYYHAHREAQKKDE